MMKKPVISALYFEDTREVKCGYCGKKLCFCEKFTKKSTKGIDKQNYSAIISMKCTRCGTENELKL